MILHYFTMFWVIFRPNILVILGHFGEHVGKYFRQNVGEYFRQNVGEYLHKAFGQCLKNRNELTSFDSMALKMSCSKRIDWKRREFDHKKMDVSTFSEIIITGPYGGGGVKK